MGGCLRDGSVTIPILPEAPLCYAQVMNEPVLSRLQQLMTIREGVENLGQPGPWHPAADWVDNGTHLLLLLDVPGVNIDTLTLEEQGDTVTITGERATPEHTLSTERPSGSFNRALTFPEEVLPQTGQASVKNGVLTVQFEKKHPTIDVACQTETNE